MAKKSTGRRTIRIDVDAAALKQRMITLGVTRQTVVDRADDAGIQLSVGSVDGATGNGKASPATIRALAIALELSPAAFILQPEDHLALIAEIEVLLPFQVQLRRRGQFQEFRGRGLGRERKHDKGHLLRIKDPMQCVQDKKNLIKDPKLSRSLIKGIGVPSLFDAVYSSVTFTPIDDDHKDEPFVRDMTYNHFLMIGVVLVVNGKQDKTAIGYHRSVSHLKGTYKHTQGLSILWATGFEFNLKEAIDRDMWNWMKLASLHPDRAEDTFLGKEDPALLRLFSHKLSLTPSVCSIRPLCVVTNDQRKTKPRVYTQYIFQIDVTPRGKANIIEQIMNTYVTEPDQPVAVPFKHDMHKHFTNHKGEPNLMDTAAWQALHPRKYRDAPPGVAVAGFEVHGG